MTDTPKKPKMPDRVYANGVGVGLELWFSKPRIFHLIFRQDEWLYVPLGDKKSSPLNGGFSISLYYEDKHKTIRKKLNKIYSETDCLVFMSEDKQLVQDFTERSRRVLKDLDMSNSVLHNIVKEDLEDSLKISMKERKEQISHKKERCKDCE